MKTTFCLFLLLFTRLVYGQIPGLTDSIRVVQRSVFLETNAENPVLNTWQVNDFYNQLIRFNTEPSYVTPPYADAFGPRSYVLTADINPAFLLLATKRSRWSFMFTPRVKVRILWDESLPVRTPSFMPGATVFYHRSDDTAHFSYGSAAIFHHSNGQDGAELLANGDFNRINGNFTTNFTELAWNWGRYRELPPINRRLNLLGTASQRIRDDALSYYKLGLQAHFGSDSVLASGRYGLWRINFHTHRIRIGQYVNRLSLGKNGQDVRVVEDRYRAEKDRISLQVSYILDRYDGYSFFDMSRRINLEGRYYFHFRSQFSNSSVFAGLGYYGQDPYNVYLQDHYFFARLGLAYGLNVYRANR